MSTIDRLRDRYLHDPVFHRYVDEMRHAIRELHLGPGEVRDAAMLASYIELERMPPESLRVDDEPRQACGKPCPGGPCRLPRGHAGHCQD